MRLYPAAPRPLRATIAADLLALVLLAVFAVLAVQVHDGVDQLAQIGQGVEEAGGSIQGAFESAANGVDGLPLVGGQLSDTLRSAGDSTAARALDATAVAEHEELLARRAVLSLPYADLLRHTRDPFGDLQRGHTAPLVAAALEEAGIRTPRAR
jgi:hypothetical protein